MSLNTSKEHRMIDYAWKKYTDEHWTHISLNTKIIHIKLIIYNGKRTHYAGN